MRINSAPATGRLVRPGGILLESLLILPLFLGVLVAVIEFSLVLVANQKLQVASSQGARVASQGGNEEDVAQTVRRALGPGRLEDASIKTLLTDQRGRPLPSGASVVVVVEVPANQAAPDLLRIIGISLRDETLVGRAVMRKE